tara:strand:- start:3925 stop:4977 length:1053 start_codon:yes stop_codon:yes gene_type:complete
MMQKDQQAAVPEILPCPVTSDELPEALHIYFGENRRGEHFINPWTEPLSDRFADFLRWRRSANPFAREKRQRPSIEVLSHPSTRYLKLPEGGRIAWLGHASVLAQVGRLSVLIDPVLGRIGGLLPRKARAPMRVDELPEIQAVLISHGHYDHLCRGSLRALARRFGDELLFITPLGLSRYLPSSCRRRLELDWWQGLELQGTEVHLVPAQHWHKRGPFDTNKALWGGWVVRGPCSLYHSGDTGYFGGFEAIGRVFPGLDLAVLPLGAYEPRWFMKPQHMNPRESLQALLDLGAERMLAMHWGTFDLSDEPLDHGRQILNSALTELGLTAERVEVLAHGASIPIQTTRKQP